VAKVAIEDNTLGDATERTERRREFDAVYPVTTRSNRRDPVTTARDSKGVGEHSATTGWLADVC